MLAAASAFDGLAWAAVVGGILGLVGLVGASIAVLKSSIASNTIKLLQANNQALHDQNDQQEHTITTQEHEIDILKGRVGKQQEQIELLKDMVTGNTILSELSVKIDSHHQAVMLALEAKQ